MPIGAGFAPAGSSSAGYGLPDLGTLPNNALLPQFATGLPGSGRFINPVTKDYQFTSDGRLMGMGSVPQIVQLALTTKLGTCAVSTLGQTYYLIQEKGSDFARQVQSSITRALSDAVKRGLVQIVSIVVTDYPKSPDASVATLTWVDLTTGIQQPPVLVSA
jgi:hypothetical protein